MEGTRLQDSESQSGVTRGSGCAERGRVHGAVGANRGGVHGAVGAGLGEVHGAVCAERVAVRYCELAGLLRQMKVPSVRGDFLAGRVLRCDNLESMLILIDSMHDLFLPGFCSDPCERVAKNEIAGKHFKLLMEESEDLFEIPCDYVVKTKYKYSTWMRALSKLYSCSYWDEGQIQNEERTKTEIFGDVGRSSEYDEDFKTSVDCKRKIQPSRRTSKVSVGDQEKVREVRFSGRQSGYRHVKGRDSPRLGSQSDSTDRDSELSEKRPVRQSCSRSKAKKLTRVEIAESSECSSSEVQDSSASETDHGRGRSRRYPKEVVAPECFNVDGRGSLKDFLADFERYFSIKFEGNQRDRCRELGRFLEGEVKDAYEAVGGPFLKYKEVKMELLEWYKSQKVGSAYKRKAELTQARMKEEESFKLYSMRLEELAYRAYPHDKPERAKRLRRQLLSTVPTWFARCVEKREETKKVLNPRAKVTWEDIVAVAENEDKKKKKKNLMKTETNVEDSFVARVATTQNVSQSDKRTAAPPKSSPVLQPRYQRDVNFSSYRCHYCGEVGHVEARCAMKQKDSKCFCCGETGHFYQNCPEYMKLAPSSSSEFKPLCHSCGGRHLGMHCPSSRGDNPTNSAMGNPRSSESGAIPKVRSLSSRGGHSGFGRGRQFTRFYRGGNGRRNEFGTNVENLSMFSSATGLEEEVSPNFEPLGEVSTEKVLRFDLSSSEN